MIPNSYLAQECHHPYSLRGSASSPDSGNGNDSIKLVVGLDAEIDMDLHRLDLIKTFLNLKLDDTEVIYMEVSQRHNVWSRALSVNACKFVLCPVMTFDACLYSK
jgi:hypothetical protein